MATRDDKGRRAVLEAKIARLGRGRELTTRCTWPGGALEFELAVLTQAERSQAEVDAVRALKAKGLDPDAMSEAVLAEKAVHVLAAAMRDMKGERLFADADELASVATDQEVERLAELYARHRNASDPNLDTLTADELAEIDDALKKKDLIRLSDIALAMPKPCLHTLVAMLAISLIGKSMSIALSLQPPTPSADEINPLTSPNATA